MVENVVRVQREMVTRCPGRNQLRRVVVNSVLPDAKVKSRGAKAHKWFEPLRLGLNAERKENLSAVCEHSRTTFGKP